MNRIVRERYPVARLPEDLREGLGAEATVIIETDPGSLDAHEADRPPRAAPASWAQLLRRGQEVQQANFTSIGEVDDYVRSLRD